MMIGNLVQICQGELKEKPPIASVTNLTTKVEKVNRGSAFFALNSSKDEVKEALENGAYAIICAQDFFIKDKEVAWIKVDTVHKALLRMMRFEIEKNEIQVVFLSSLQLDMLRMFSFNFDAHITPTSFSDMFSLLFEMKTKSYLFSSDIDFVKTVAPEFKKIEPSFPATILQSHNIFRSSFVCNENYFKDFPIPPLFIPEFSAVILFLNKNELFFKVEAMDKIGHFEPRFINQAFRPRAFGSTAQALIIESDAKLFEKEALWLEDYVPKSEFLLLAPHNEKLNIECKRYTSVKVIQTLNISGLRYILMLGEKEQILEALEAPSPAQPTLF